MSSDSSTIPQTTPISSDSEPIPEETLYDESAPFCCFCGWKIAEWDGFCSNCANIAKMKCSSCDDPKNQEEHIMCDSCAWSLVHVFYEGCGGDCCPPVTVCSICTKKQCECTIGYVHIYITDPENLKYLMILKSNDFKKELG